MEHTKSSMRPLAWVGPRTLCMMLKQSRRIADRNSVANVQMLESTWILKSPSRSVDGDMEQTEVSSSDSSDMKVVEAFGRAVDKDHLELCRPSQCESNTLKRGDVEYWKIFNDKVSSMYNSQPTTTTHGVRLTTTHSLGAWLG